MGLLQGSSCWSRKQGDGRVGDWGPLFWNLGCTHFLEGRRAVGLECNSGWSKELCDCACMQRGPVGRQSMYERCATGGIPLRAGSPEQIENYRI